MLNMILLYRDRGNIAAVALLTGASLAELELAEGWPVPKIDHSWPCNGYLDVITADHTVTLPGWPAWGEVPRLFSQTLVVRGETPWPKHLLTGKPPSPDLFWRVIGRPELQVRFNARPGSDPQYHILAVSAPGCEGVRLTFRDGNMIDYPAGYGVAVCNLGAATPDGTPGGLHPLRQVKSVCVVIDGTAYPVAIDEEPCVSTRPSRVDPAKPPPAVPPTNWRPVAPWAASMHDAVTAESATVFHSTPPDAPSPYAADWQHDEKTGWPAGAKGPKPPAKPDPAPTATGKSADEWVWQFADELLTKYSSALTAETLALLQANAEYLRQRADEERRKRQSNKE